ncbi:ABC transporter ATP-binding protein [Streptomyces cyaneofuscatus]|uniref:ABC transporter ATP-binding protein n=1 Tax=Streptomyces cyaneofuscatus TaxID=66883 RepID=A0ABZ1EVW3_9ACTN|nr:ABC transporter ATP-binding protein [Streptomyces cyaneofuscatus]WSB08276.1 ABC transporter ATP-binding protein [Streptomyces cyaneofuscatus]WSD48191.1 ABC transporter ATP-binding protein [Streptomyces cyaneofuscatus]
MPAVEVEGLCKRHGGTLAVDQVSLEIQKGEIFGILGPNGAGKTTLIECMAGLQKQDSGVVRIGGMDPQAQRSKVREILGVQLQECKLPEKLRVDEAIRIFSSFYSDPADPGKLLSDLGLADKRKTYFEHLSGGQRQRLSIALALVGQPDIVIFDELTTGLDPQARRLVWELVESVRASGTTVLLVTHNMEEADRLCDRLTLIDSGRNIACDTPAQLRMMAVQALGRGDATLEDAYLELTGKNFEESR